MTTPGGEVAIEGLIPKRGESVLVRGAGCELWDDGGRRYLDLTSAHGITPLGHCHSELTAAISDQAGRLISCSASFYNDQRAAFLDSLTQVLPPALEHVYLCNSGTEAIEAGLKFAYLLSGRSGVVALKQDFHGRTLGALATTWNPRFRKPFAAMLNSTTFVTPGDLDELEAALDHSIGLFLFEVVQGESGVLAVDADYLLEAERLCRERGVAVMVDEIQTGVGRTGAWWAHEPIGLHPDMMALAKGIAGGFPMGALVSTAAVRQVLKPGLHGSTFGGSPLACRAGRATFEVLVRDKLIDRARSVGDFLQNALQARLRGVELVKVVRGRGLMIGIELRQRVGPYLARLMNDHGVLAIPAGPTVLRLLPALVIEEEQIEEAATAIAAVLTDS
jgi:acetylornithine/LysW-gamma-L-lysine aminotransferase